MVSTKRLPRIWKVLSNFHTVLMFMFYHKTMFTLRPKISGSKKYAILTADSEKELEDAARKLKLPIHGKGEQARHLDVSGHKLKLAREKLGAAEVMNPLDRQE